MSTPQGNNSKPQDFTIDLKFLKENTGDNPSFMREMIEILTNRLPVDMDKMSEAYKSKDAETMRASAHKMKPSLEMIGALDVKELALFIEKNTREEGITDEVSEKFFELKKSIPKVVTILKKELHKL
jgi:HPt (histidine-containing phosphotransfer) domain-containing protein